MVKAFAKEIKENVTVVGYYCQPGNKVNCDRELQFAIRTLSRQRQNHNLVIAGDFNRPIAKTEELAN